MTLYTNVQDELKGQAPSLPALADLCRTADALTEAVDDMVAKLREEGVTWRVLADVTGMTQQGLMARQARLTLDRSEIREG